MAPDRSTVVQHKIRLRQTLLNELRRVADKSDTSVNEEIERRLEASFEHEKWQKDRVAQQQERAHFLLMMKMMLLSHIPPAIREEILKGIDALMSKDWKSKPVDMTPLQSPHIQEVVERAWKQDKPRPSRRD